MMGFGIVAIVSLGLGVLEHFVKQWCDRYEMKKRLELELNY